MKKVNIVCVGKLKEKYFAGAIAEYSKRLGKYAEFKIKELPDEADSVIAIKKESDKILENLSGYTILLDICGEQISSPELSAIIDSAYTSGFSEVTFIIGGSNGVSDDVRRAVKKRISFGKVTYPHQLMRVILTEQIYRAFTIINNAPYHK